MNLAFEFSPGRLLGLSATLALSLFVMPANAQRPEAGCSFAHGGGAGPFDYRSQRQMLQMVERRHFTSRVERLVSGESTKELGPDLGYTLNKFPNHHRALISLSRLALRLKVGRVAGMEHSVNCYFERALRVAPDDTVAHQVYALHLGRDGRQSDALARLRTALQHAKDNPVTVYNLGMVALEVGDPAFARERAQQAAEMGHPGTALRDALKKAGHWAEPPSPPPADAASAAAAAAASAPVSAGADAAASAPAGAKTTP